MAPELERIGPYELAEEVGSGGMGTVYRAVDTRTGQTVALKVMDPRLAKDPDYVRRFQREAEIAKRLDSPFVVRVLDSGQDGNQYFLVMEYVAGKNLTEVLRESGKVPPGEARSIATQVAIALEAAHSQGVVHRDIKPGNIMITKDGTAKVADFGIARAVDSATITKTGRFLGTLSYAAPELLAGKADIRSDIYSLGVVLFQMLSGRVPFEADTPLELMEMHRVQEPPRLESLGVKVPADLRTIVERCLAKQPEQRYQEPAELVAALEGRIHADTVVGDGEAGNGAPPVPPTRLQRGFGHFGGRQRYVLLGVGASGVVLAAVLVAAAIAGGWGTGGHREQANVIEPIATGTPPLLPGAAATLSTPVPTAAATNRQNCDAIRDTEYLSAEERDWFMAECVTSIPPTPTIPFRPTPPSTKCDVGPWQVGSQASDDQRWSPALAATDKYLYLVGGGVRGDDIRGLTVERAPINPDGSLGAFSLLPNSMRLLQRVTESTAVQVNGYLYLVGGNTQQYGETAAVQYSHVDPSTGNLSPWQLASPLTENRKQISLAVVQVSGSTYIYAIGGTRQDQYRSQTVEYARVNSDGTLGPWTGTTSLPGLYTASNPVAVAGSYLYLLGGVDMGKTAHRAPIQGDGSIGAWVNLGEIRAHPGAGRAVVKDQCLYVLGWYPPQPNSMTPEIASFDSAGDFLGTLALASNSVTYTYEHAVRVGDFVYVGMDGGDAPHRYVQYARLTSGGGS